MTPHDFVKQMDKMLGHLDAWLVKGAAHAEAKKFDVSVLLQGRLAPDMFSLLRQVQAACDHAKAAAFRAAGKEPPVHEDTEQTFDEARARVAKVRALLAGFGAKDYEGADARRVSLPRWEGKWMTAESYLVQQAIPNFHFHVCMAYAILRHSGVELGKRDYIGERVYAG